MSTTKFLQELKKTHDAYDSARQQLVAASNVALHDAKRAGFALLRDDAKGAEKLLKSAEASLAKVAALAKSSDRLKYEGSYRAALEEYAEAKFLSQLIEGGEVSPIPGLDEETQIGGLCDASGELVRRMTLKATAGKIKDVQALKKMIDAIVGGLSEMDYGGYLRTKYDQARNHLRKAEEILYDLSLRRG